jgi:tRNA(Ile)-lysidine synthase
VAPRTHPPSLRALAERLVRERALFARGDLVLVATSGGPDSTALLSVLALLRKRLGHALVACGVDHGLREGAGAELDLAEEHARSLEVPFVRRAVSVGAGAGV